MSNRKGFRGEMPHMLVTIVMACALAFEGVPTSALAEVVGDASQEEMAYGWLEEDNAPLDAATDGDLPPETEEPGDEGSADGPAAVVDPPGDDDMDLGTSVAQGYCGSCSWALDYDGTLTISAGTLDDASYYDWPWEECRDQIKRVRLNGRVVALNTLSGIFYECPDLIDADLSNLDVSFVTDMHGMFQDCSSLSSLDVSGWDTSSVTDMHRMFDGCSSLSSLDVSGWDTSNVASMEGMFKGCSALFTLDVSSWDTSSVTEMSFMFHSCSSLSSLDVSGWDTSNVASMEGMFKGCSALSSLNVSGWDTSSVTTMWHMFSGCSSLSSLDVSGWDTSSVTEMSNMFYGCSSLSSLDASGWDTANVTSMVFMFSGCSSLSSLDVSRWDISSVDSLNSIFGNCLSLSELDLSGWDTSGVRNKSWMFYGCSSLTSIRVGNAYLIKSSDMFPDATNADGKWWSTNDSMWYTKGEIVSGRSGIADTYLASTQTSGTPLSGCTVKISRDSYVYSGDSCMPAVSVKDGSKTLVKGTHYSVAYANNVNAGTAHVIMTAIAGGGYTGSTRIAFTIERADVSASTISAISDQTYTGSAIRPSVTVKVGSETLELDYDYTLSYSNNVSAGTATVTVTGKGNYTGTKTATFRIIGSTELPTMTLATTSYTYDGTAKKPSATVKVGSATLASGTDYTLSYSNNVNAGTATATATLKGSYSGTATATFTISPASVSSATVASIPDQTYTGSAIRPAVTLNLGGRTLVSGTDYTLSYSNNTAVGTATVTATGKGNYTGTKSATFRIVASSAAATMTLATTSYTYDGTAKKPSATVKVGSATLASGTDYTLSYSDNVDAGTATATATLKGSYAGTATATFTISPASVSSATVSSIPDQAYTGSAIRPSVTVRVGSRTLTSGTDYTLSYSNNTSVGTATVTATGKGNYTGTKVATFRIVRPAAQTAFEWGKDNLSFNNTRSRYGGTRYIDQIDERHVDMLMDRLDNTEKSWVFNGWTDYSGRRHEGLAYKTWGGSCYGMSVVTLLSKAGYVPWSQYEGGAANLNRLRAPKDSQDVSNLVTYYFLLQNKRSVQNAFWEIGTRSHENNITEAVELLETNPLVHICFSNDQTGIGHSILAYGVEYGSWRLADGVTYRGRLLIDDPNNNEGWQSNDDFCLYFNPTSYEWEIPAYDVYQIRSSKGARIDYVGADPAAMNDGGFLSGSQGAGSSAAMAHISAFSLGSQPSVTKVRESDGTFFAAYTGPDDIIERDSHVLSGEGEGTPGYILRDASSAYRVSQKSASELSLTMDYEGLLMTASCAAGRSAIFDPSGYAMVSGDTGAYSLSLTMDEGCPTDWYDVNVVGEAADKSSLRVADGGYVLESDGLSEGVTVNARNDDDAAAASFSTDASSVLIYEADGGTIGVRADKDGNGTFETTVRTSGAPQATGTGWRDLPGGGKGYARDGRWVTGWLTLGEDKYWFGSDGAAATGWRQVDGQTYYFREDGTCRMARGWATVEGKKYLFRSDGRVGEGWVTWDGNKYYADAGVPRTGWQEIAGTRYYFRGEGDWRMASGWATVAGKKLLFRSDGRLADGWVSLDGASYYADEGVPREGWQDIQGSGRRFFRPAPDYRMATGWATIGGKKVQFDSLGRQIG